MLTAAFSAGQGSKAGGIGYQEECFPTLKAAESGTNMVPSVLCLNDQGASVMDCSENVSGTLRAQEHGRQPLVYENHGIDSRYTGPHKDATDLVVDVAGLDCRNAAENGDLCGTLQKGTSGSSLNSIDPIRNGLLIRRLTPLECERLQGFPDGWTDIPGASDSARYKALGNSVALPCVEFIMSRIAAALL